MMRRNKKSKMRHKNKEKKKYELDPTLVVSSVATVFLCKRLNSSKTDVRADDQIIVARNVY